MRSVAIYKAIDLVTTEQVCVSGFGVDAVDVVEV